VENENNEFYTEAQQMVSLDRGPLGRTKVTLELGFNVNSLSAKSKNVERWPVFEKKKGKIVVKI